VRQFDFLFGFVCHFSFLLFPAGSICTYIWMTANNYDKPIYLSYVESTGFAGFLAVEPDLFQSDSH